MALGLYAYGVIEAGTLSEPLGVDGLEPGLPVSIFSVDDLAALVSEVEISEYEGETLEGNLARSEWLEAKVRAHERVLEAAIELTTVVPMRFGSIFSTSDALTSMLSDHKEDLSRSIDLIRGRAEWSVRVHYRQEDSADHLVATRTETVTGRDYLLLKKEALRAVEEAAVSAEKLAEQVHANLARIAAGAVRTQPVGQPNRNVILCAAYLVTDEDRSTFMETVERLQQEHAGKYMFEVTGPWPPYNFTNVDVSGARS
jgi:hypothetical protein